VQYKLCQARILDSQRKFNEAGAKYHELSYEVAIDEEERIHMLSAAVKCAILGPAGPQRSRLLATLYRDDRSQDLDHYPILAATFLDHIIRPEQVATFAASLSPHQLAKLPTSGFRAPLGSAAAATPAPGAKHAPETVLDRAVMEHNLLSASRLYSNITFDGLGSLLSLTPYAAEAMARTMIQQGRLKGSLDQVERLITFDAAEREVEGAVSNVAAAGEAQEGETDHDAVVAPETLRWDRQIRTAAQAVEDLASRVEALGTVAPPAVPVSA
jgi:COP9 signalosome complex subunit 4